ncbi:MAG TPA: hypothetical protein VND92_01000 [Vicinamibacterales bacterium]|nr:hypothetical protein [Vicinamibacterales bacterium]
MQSAPPAPVVQTIQVPSGTTITVRLAQALSTVRNRAGDTFDAILDEPVVVGGRVVLPRGTTFTGHVTEARSSGRLKGRAVLSITLDTFDLRQQSYAVRTAVETSVTRAHEKRNLEMIGGGSGIGALIGGLTGGGKGAALGAAVGAAAGTGVAAGTGRKDVELPADTLRRFRLTRPIEVRQ